MILVIGGKANGKRTYLRELGFDDSAMSDGAFDDRPVLLNLQDAMRDDDRTPEELADALSGKQAITCCEVGSGIVPIEPDQREWRDNVGKTCSLLADRADSVVRMVCGIPMVLK